MISSANLAQQDLERNGIESNISRFFNGFHGKRLIVDHRDARRAEQIVGSSALKYQTGKRCFEFYG